MKATIKTYQTNALLFNERGGVNIDWDGVEFDTKDEYRHWIEEQLTPAEGCENYAAVRQALEIATDYLRPASLAEQLAAIRKRMGIPQKELAERLGFTQQNLARIESGKGSAREEVLRRIAQMLGVKIVIKS